LREGGSRQALHGFGHVPGGGVPNSLEYKGKKGIGQAERPLQVELRLVDETTLRAVGNQGDSISVAQYRRLAGDDEFVGRIVAFDLVG
jgi:hypothetical protein